MFTIMTYVNKRFCNMYVVIWFSLCSLFFGFPTCGLIYSVVNEVPDCFYFKYKLDPRSYDHSIMYLLSNVCLKYGHNNL